MKKVTICLFAITLIYACSISFVERAGKNLKTHTANLYQNGKEQLNNKVTFDHHHMLACYAGLGNEGRRGRYIKNLTAGYQVMYGSNNAGTAKSIWIDIDLVPFNTMRQIPEDYKEKV